MDLNHPDYWKQIGHYYGPIAAYGGLVLKYHGIATHGNRDHVMARPGMQLLPAYLGDRIRADTHEVFTGL